MNWKIGYQCNNGRKALSIENKGSFKMDLYKQSKIGLNRHWQSSLER